MKKASAIAASAAAASVAVGYKSDRYVVLTADSNEGAKRKDGGSESRRGGENEKFAPRFDGLRFIETLVTAHR